MKINKNIIKELNDYLEEFNLTEIEYTEKDIKVKVSKSKHLKNFETSEPKTEIRPVVEDAVADNSTVPAKKLPNMKFVDYLALQNKVSKGAFAFWMRRWGAKPRSMGYLLDNIHNRIERRPDVLESVLWDAEGQKLFGPALVGFVVSEIKIRIPA